MTGDFLKHYLKFFHQNIFLWKFDCIKNGQNIEILIFGSSWMKFKDEKMFKSSGKFEKKKKLLKHALLKRNKKHLNFLFPVLGIEIAQLKYFFYPLSKSSHVLTNYDARKR